MRNDHTSARLSSTLTTRPCSWGRIRDRPQPSFLLHALAACLTSDLANIAAARGVTLAEVRSTVTGDIDLNGILGLDAGVRNGYQQITVHFTVKGDAPAEKLREIVEQSRARSAVFDVITSGVPRDHRRGYP